MLNKKHIIGALLALTIISIKGDVSFTASQNSVHAEAHVAINASLPECENTLAIHHSIHMANPSVLNGGKKCKREALPIATSRR